MKLRPARFLRETFKYACVKDGYRIDPFAMAFANLPDEYKDQGLKIYYKLSYRYFPRAWKFLFMIYGQIKPLILYATFVRVNKKYCPYLIRWHWTYIFIFNIFENESARIIYRLNIYVNTVAVPARQSLEVSILRSIITGIISLNFLFIYFAMLH